MDPVPWKYVKSWNCVACGSCCRGYQVVLRFNEWVRIASMYGVGVTKPGLNKFFLKRRGDGTCVFLSRFLDTSLCGLQNSKPKACKLWPFRVLTTPKFGRPIESAYMYGNRNFFVYVDPRCHGLRWGTPTREFMYRTLNEFLEIALEMRDKQRYSTGKVPIYPINWGILQ